MRKHTGTLKTLLGLALCGAMMTGCGNTSDTQTTTVPTVTPTVAEYLVYPNTGTNNVQVAVINTLNGALGLIPAAGAATGNNPVFAKTHPNNQWIYEANNGSANVFGFVLNAATGVLGSLPNVPYATVTAPASLGINPSGTILYAAGSTQVQPLFINADGSLSNIVGGVVNLPLPAAPCAMAFTQTTGAIYVNIATGNGSTAGITSFLINPANGLLTQVGTVSTPGATFTGLAANANGSVVYAALQTSSNQGQVVPFLVNNDGSLSGSTPVGLNGAPGELVLTNSGNLYVSTSPSTVLGFVTDNTGALAAIAGSPFPVGAPMNFIGLDPSQTLLYGASTQSNLMAGFQILSNGAIQSAAGNPYTTLVAAPGHFDFAQFSQGF